MGHPPVVAGLHKIVFPRFLRHLGRQRLLLLEELRLDALRFLKLALHAAATAGDALRRLHDAGDLLFQLLLRRRLTLHVLLRRELLLLHLPQQHAGGGELLAPEFQVLGDLRVPGGELLDRLLPLRLVGLQLLPLLVEQVVHERRQADDSGADADQQRDRREQFVDLAKPACPGGDR